MRGLAAKGATARIGVLLVGVAFLGVGCGGGAPTQDENEPEGEFKVDIVKSEFPEEQQLAKASQMVVKVKNVDTRTIPKLNVTVQGFDYELRDPGNPEDIDPNVADPERPVFVVDKSPNEFLLDRSEDDQSLIDREVYPPAGGDNPSGGDTAFVNNYQAGGELAPGDTATFRWDLSAVEARPFLVRYEVNAGYDGKAKAVTPDGERPTGTFRGVIEREAPDARVASGDGETIVSDNGRRENPSAGSKRSNNR